MTRTIALLIGGLLLAAMAFAADPNLPAFPSAEGLLNATDPTVRDSLTLASGNYRDPLSLRLTAPDRRMLLEKSFTPAVETGWSSA